jgi:hypothetical protein
MAATYTQDQLQRCGVCGEKFTVDSWGDIDDEMGEFVDAESGEHIIAHSECGLNSGLAVA